MRPFLLALLVASTLSPVAAQDTVAVAALERPATVSSDTLTLAERIEEARAITWTGEARRAAALLAPLAETHPLDADLQAAYAQALHADQQVDAARAQYAVALALRPEDALLLASAGDLERWSGDWTVARRRLRRALDLGLPDADARRARTLLDSILKEHGLLLETGFRLDTDSNGLTRRRAPLTLSSHLVGPWRAVLRAEQVGLIQDRPVVPGSGRVETLRMEGQVSLTPTRALTVDATLGADAGADAPIRSRAGLAVSRRWLGRRYGIVTARLTRSPYEAGGPEAYRLASTDLAAEAYVDLTPRLATYGTALRRSISDGNATTHLSGALRGRVAGRTTDQRPAPAALYVTTTALYETAREVNPLAQPYWTPDRLTTLSATADADVRLTRSLDLGGSLGLSRQEGPLGDASSLVLAARAGWTSRHTLLRAEWRQEGSVLYSIRYLRLTAGLRW